MGEASDGCEVLDRVQELDPDVLLLDLRMPNLDGLSALQALQQTNKRTRVIVLTASEDKNEFVQAMKLGCSGIVLKQTAPGVDRQEHPQSSRRRDLAGFAHHRGGDAAVRRAGRRSAAAAAPARPASAPRSSQREREIVQLVAQGYKNKEMAEKMFISEQTVKNHLHNIFDKLGVSDRLELALYAIHKGLHLAAER